MISSEATCKMKVVKSFIKMQINFLNQRNTNTISNF